MIKKYLVLKKGGIISVENFEGVIECPPANEICPNNNDKEKKEFNFFESIYEKLLNVVLDFINWIYSGRKN